MADAGAMRDEFPGVTAAERTRLRAQRDAALAGSVVPDSALLALETAWNDIPDLTEAARGTEREQVVKLDSALDAFFDALATHRAALGVQPGGGGDG